MALLAIFGPAERERGNEDMRFVCTVTSLRALIINFIGRKKGKQARAKSTQSVTNQNESEPVVRFRHMRQYAPVRMWACAGLTVSACFSPFQKAFRQSGLLPHICTTVRRHLTLVITTGISAAHNNKSSPGLTSRQDPAFVFPFLQLPRQSWAPRTNAARRRTAVCLDVSWSLCGSKSSVQIF